MEDLLPGALSCLAVSGLSASPGASAPSFPSVILVYRNHRRRARLHTMMDRASLALAQGLAEGVPKSLRAIADHRNVPLSTVHARARGRESIETKAQRQQYLRPFEERALVDFILEMSELGTPIRNKFIPSIALSITRHRLEADRPASDPNKNWTKAFERRHPELQTRRAKALNWKRHDKNIYPKVEDWFDVIGKVLGDDAIVAENVYNMDETGVMLSMLGSVNVLVGKDDHRDYRGARVERTMVTAIECISADGRYLDPMIIWPAATHRSNWTTHPTPGWHYACSKSGYTDSKISLEWLKKVFDPQTRERAGGKKRLLICDGFGTHETLEVLEHCRANDIRLCRLPSHTSHKLQPCDIAVFAPLKAAYRDAVERLERGGVNAIGKQHFTFLYSAARTKAFTKKNILAGWSKGGLYPFNPQRVLKDLVKPLAEAAPPDAGGEPALSPGLSQHETPGIFAAPGTPVTPVTAEAFLALHDFILERDAHALDDPGKQSIQRHLQKFTKGAQTYVARGVLQQERIKSLLKTNDEAKVRRTTKSLVLGKAKVMSYEDLVEARTKRAAKDARKAAKRQRRKRKSDQEVVPVAALQTPYAAAVKSADGQVWTSQAEHAAAPVPPYPGAAPVARMW